MSDVNRPTRPDRLDLDTALRMADLDVGPTNGAHGVSRTAAMVLAAEVRVQQYDLALQEAVTRDIAEKADRWHTERDELRAEVRALRDEVERLRARDAVVRSYLDPTVGGSGTWADLARDLGGELAALPGGAS